MSRETKLFFLLAYLFSWLAMAPLALQGLGLLSGVPRWLHFVGAFGPLLAAFVVTAASGGAALRAWLRHMLRWPGGTWLLFALLGPVALFLLAVSLLRLFGASSVGLEQFGHLAEFPQLSWMAGWLLWILTFGLGEEVGWRGFALPRLQSQHSARGASIILGLFWAGWHLPAFFYNYELSFFGVLAFLVSILSGAAFLTWLFNSTGGSVLATMLWHGSYNAAVAGADGALSTVVTAAIIFAVIVIANRYGPETFSPREKQTYREAMARRGVAPAP